MRSSYLAMLIAIAPGALHAQPAAPPVPELRVSDVRLSTGVRLEYAEQGSREGVPVIMLHGYSDSWFSFSRMLPHLSDELHVYALSLRGQGDSDRPAGGYGMRELARDVVAFMDAQGIGRAVIVGHSMGTFVTQQIALLAPDRVVGIVLLDGATHMLRMNGIEDLQAAVADLSDPISREFVREFQLSTINLPVPDEFMASVIAESGKLPADVWRALLDGMIAMEPVPAKALTKIPALLLWGERDALFSRAEQDALLRRIGGGTLIVYPEVGHTPHWERPQEVARDLEAFVKATSLR